MTKNEIIEIIEMARQAGARQMISSLTHPNGPVTALKFDLDNGSIEAFTKLVAEKAIKEALAQPEPVAMKFKIYKPTVPDPLRQDINNALLPWVYDQDQSSGFDATMWVTPVATLPPQRKPLSDEQIAKIASTPAAVIGSYVHTFARAIEAAHGIKE